LTGPTVGGTLAWMAGLEAVGGDLHGALEDVSVPSYVIDVTGVIRWVNPAARRLVGDCRGRQFTSIVVPEERRRAREVFAQKVIGTTRVTDTWSVILDEDGERVEVELTSVPLKEGHKVVGVFGQVPQWEEVDQTTAPHPHLTPRQGEVLRLLEHGRSTAQIASELHVSQETVRNHVKHLLRALGVNSRLEAVAAARRERLTDQTAFA
jgi:PAS domain S-box-containing protein